MPEDQYGDEPYVDPNSGLAAQPGGFGLNLHPELGEDEEDPNPDPGGAEAVFATDGQQEATPVDDDGESIDDDELEDADPSDELEDPNPDPGGAEAQLSDGQNAVHDHEVETQGANADAAPADLDPENPRAGEQSEVVDGTSPDEAPDAQPGADEQVAGPEATDAPVEPAPVVEEPNKGASRDAWAEFAKSKGAPEEETAEGGLKRDELAAKYGTSF